MIISSIVNTNNKIIGLRHTGGATFYRDIHHNEREEDSGRKRKEDNKSQLQAHVRS